MKDVVFEVMRHGSYLLRLVSAVVIGFKYKKKRMKIKFQMSRIVSCKTRCVRDRSGILFRLIQNGMLTRTRVDEKDIADSPTCSFYGGAHPNAVSFLSISEIY